MDPVTILLGIGSKVIDKIWPDETQANAAKLELMKMQMSGELAQMAGQLKINEVEAANPNWFVSGARPFVMWVCGVGLAMQFLVLPLVQWGLIILGKSITLPPLDMGTLITLLSGMLGLGTLRTVEKLSGVNRN